MLVFAAVLDVAAASQESKVELQTMLAFMIYKTNLRRITNFTRRIIYTIHLAPDDFKRPIVCVWGDTVDLVQVLRKIDMDALMTHDLGQDDLLALCNTCSFHGGHKKFSQQTLIEIVHSIRLPKLVTQGLDHGQRRLEHEEAVAIGVVSCRMPWELIQELVIEVTVRKEGLTL